MCPRRSPLLALLLALRRLPCAYPLRGTLHGSRTTHGEAGKGDAWESPSQKSSEPFLGCTSVLSPSAVWGCLSETSPAALPRQPRLEAWRLSMTQIPGAGRGTAGPRGHTESRFQREHNLSGRHMAGPSSCQNLPPARRLPGPGGLRRRVADLVTGDFLPPRGKHCPSPLGIGIFVSPEVELQRCPLQRGRRRAVSARLPAEPFAPFPKEGGRPQRPQRSWEIFLPAMLPRTRTRRRRPGTSRRAAAWVGPPAPPAGRALGLRSARLRAPRRNEPAAGRG